MGLLSSLFGSTETTTVEHPCSNCATDCKVCPAACDECRGYKEKLVDLLYNVDNIEAFRAKYEVVSAVTENTGSCTCPACGGPNPVTVLACEYCGTALRESTGKIQVTTANDIPNPILQAQDLIFERRALENKYLTQSNESAGGFLSALSSFLGSSGSTLGDKMTEDEITAAAGLYEVSVSSYLQGLDNGKYLTYALKKQKDSLAQSNAAYAGTAGAVGAGAAFGQNNRPPMPPQGGHGMPGGPRPPQGQPFGGQGYQQGRPQHGNTMQQTSRPQQTGTVRQDRPVEKRPVSSVPGRTTVTSPANKAPGAAQKSSTVSRPAQNSRPAQPSGTQAQRPGKPSTPASNKRTPGSFNGNNRGPGPKR